MVSEDRRSLHRHALQLADGFVDRITASDLTRATPCADWDLGQLLAHMIGQHRGFAAATRDGTAPVSAYAPVRFTLAEWHRSVDELLAAFDAADLAESVIEVELHPTKPLPMPVIIGAQLLDTAVHTWDVARSVDRTFTPDDELAEAVLKIAEPIPDDELREAPGAAFAHSLPATGSPWERALALLGRDPHT